MLRFHTQPKISTHTGTTTLCMYYYITSLYYLYGLSKRVNLQFFLNSYKLICICWWVPSIQASLAAFWSPSRLEQIASLARELSSLALNIRAKLLVIPHELLPPISTDNTSIIPSQQTMIIRCANFIPEKCITIHIQPILNTVCNIHKHFSYSLSRPYIVLRNCILRNCMLCDII